MLTRGTCTLVFSQMKNKRTMNIALSGFSGLGEVQHRPLTAPHEFHLRTNE